MADKDRLIDQSSQRLRRARIAKVGDHLGAVADLARRAQVPYGTYWAWENDTNGNGVPWNGCVKVASILGVSPEWIKRGVGLGIGDDVVTDPQASGGSIPREYIKLAGRVVDRALKTRGWRMIQPLRDEAVADVAELLKSDGVPIDALPEKAAERITDGVFNAFLKPRSFKP